jgi:tRNA pseudouridine32 synthase/23S rRNA pseudouridine746 synthase
MPRNVFHKTISKDDPDTLCDALHHISGLSKVKLKDAMAKGAAWIRRPGKKKRRIRRAKAVVRPKDTVWLYYDPDILGRRVPEARCEMDRIDYSIWFKPAGMMSQGSPFGDHCSLPFQIERHFPQTRKVYPVHRLDREVPGLILVAHTRHAAAVLSEMLRENRIEKQYYARVKGDLRSSDADGKITLPLDGRRAVTTFEVTSYDSSRLISTAIIRIGTGRHHQIRRHFDLIGHPVMGDPRYGKDNSDPAGLQLTASALSFNCPFGGGTVQLSIDPFPPF